MKKPDFIFIGTGKSGTTWLFKNLQKHSDIYVSETKETNFFDLNYSRGLDWYLKFFEKANEDQKIGEISHRYIHVPETATRILNNLGKIKIIIGLRDPMSYMISDYQFVKRNGRFSGSLDDWAEHGFDFSTVHYKTMISPFLEIFGKENIYIYNFSDLEKNSIEFFNRITDFLEVPRLEASKLDKNKINKASKARIPLISLLVNIMSKFFKRRGFQKAIQYVKNNKLLMNLLYEPADKKPKPSKSIVSKIDKETFHHIEWLEIEFNQKFKEKWKKLKEI